ncbi:hypothetical protein BGW38_005791 [Lunasporangiospora selenospora]|uniref:ATP-dependent DNA helicase RecQ zinc-binding domain-containing protein n=1 Tax=Lunasporangiospora selenospora TaxID=979761 RepID=A0A9P6G1G2_9FUNG|nr:hypothetical protein BGW38_005791 [Lunasporangiospora selenospora]
MAIYSMTRYAQNIRTCRHQLFDIHFSKHITKRLPPCGFCDNCLLSPEFIVAEDIRADVRALCVLLEKLAEVNERVTLNKLVEAWQGVGGLRVIAKTVREEYGTQVACKRTNKDDYDRIINHLVVNNYLREDFHFTVYSTVA